MRHGVGERQGPKVSGYQNGGTQKTSSCWPVCHAEIGTKQRGGGGDPSGGVARKKEVGGKLGLKKCAGMVALGQLLKVNLARERVEEPK